MTPHTMLAAIDVGTNSFHLLVAKLLGQGRFSVVTKDKVVVRLGESPSQIKRLTTQAMDRGVQAMQALVNTATRLGAPVYAVATSAVREAENAEEFIERVRQVTGVSIEVVSGFEEARLIYLGVLQALPVYDKRIVLFDIGGGSTEFLLGENGTVGYANSFKIGAIRMTQRFFPDEAITQSQADECALYVSGEIYHAARTLREGNPQQVVASSGTVQTIAAMVIAARGERVPESLNGYSVTRQDVRTALNRIIAAPTIAARAAIPGVDPRRADILAAGAVVLDTIMGECGFDKFTISSYALREGVVLDTIRKLEGDHGAPAHLSNLRYQTVMRIGRMYNFDENHGRHVADLALQMYDALQPLHKLEDNDRELLEAAALLHDIGYYISHASHHRHSGYLIRNSEAFGFTNDEIEVIATVARYHRKSHPRNRHEEFAGLPAADQQRVRVMSGILRIADGMDRTSSRVVESVDTAYTDRAVSLIIHCRPEADPTFELWSIERKKELLEESLNRKVVAVVGDNSVPADTDQETVNHT